MLGGPRKSKFKDRSLGEPVMGGNGRRGGGTVGGLATMLLSALITLAVLEGAVRVIDGQSFSLRNYVADKLTVIASAYPSVYDPLLGYIPRPGYAGSDNVWGTTVTIDERGLRRNGPEPMAGDAAVLAVGDSFTFGDEVSDQESWPAHLEDILGQPVANAGVFGYGLDQAVLRAERLVQELDPLALVVSFIYGDVRRTQLIQRTGAEKPYFEVVEGQLELRNVPPSENRPRIEQMGVLRTLLGYSYLADFAFRRAGATEWWYAGGFPQVQVHSDGPQVACLLMRRLKQLEQETGTRVLIVAQYLHRNILDPGSPKSIEELNGSAALLDCAEDAGLVTVDTLPTLNRLYRADPDGFQSSYYLAAHMSDAGNRVVAERVADGLFTLLAGN